MYRSTLAVACHLFLVSELLLQRPFSIFRGILIIIHGLNEHRFFSLPLLHVLFSVSIPWNDHSWVGWHLQLLHFFFSGRYSNFAKQLISCNFGVYAMDWIGMVCMLLSVYTFNGSKFLVDAFIPFHVYPCSTLLRWF